MAAPTPTAEVFTVLPSEKVDKLVVNRLCAHTLKGSYKTVIPVPTKDGTFVFGYSPTADHFDVYKFTPTEPWLQAVQALPKIGDGKDIINAFTLGNLPHICAYSAEKGIFEIYSVSSDLSLSQPYKFYRNHELAVSQGFTTLEVFTQFGQIVFLGYRDDTGYVAMYTLGVIVPSAKGSSLYRAPGVPPLQMLPVWAHTWAPKWTRFAFFYFGGESFFLKTNTEPLNVNIDHVSDTLTSGTAEVGTMLQDHLPDALAITNVEPFTLAYGEPYFVTYISDTGAATLNRFHADCLGWTQVAQFDAAPGSKWVMPLKCEDQCFLIFAQ